jgi:hypothetical protein
MGIVPKKIRRSNGAIISKIPEAEPTRNSNKYNDKL